MVTASNHISQRSCIQYHCVQDGSILKRIGYDSDLACSQLQIFMASSQGYLDSAAEESWLQSHQGQLLKCIQLYNAILVRHGVVVLGPTGSGKSTVLQLLREALNNAHEDFYGHKRKVVGNISFRASLSLTSSISEVYIHMMFVRMHHTESMLSQYSFKCHLLHSCLLTACT